MAQEWSIMAYDPEGNPDYRLEGYFGTNERKARDAFMTDMDRVPMNYKKVLFCYDGDSNAVTVASERYVTRFLPDPVTFSRTFSRLLNQWRADGDKVSIALLTISDNTDADFVDIHDDGMLSFMPQSRSFRRTCLWIPGDGVYEEKGRQYTKAARLARKMLSEEALSTLTDSDFEKFSNHAQAAEIKRVASIELVSGPLIPHWYLGSRYAGESTGSLWASCMKHAKCQPFLQFYADNPRTINMAVLVNDDNKLEGRALVWTANDGRFLMDRIYGSDSTQQKFKNFARKMGWWHKRHQAIGYNLDLYDPSGHSIDDTIMAEIDVVESRTETYPYMDTMHCLDMRDKVIHNNSTYPHDRSIGDTSGGYRQRRRDEMTFPMYRDGQPPLVPCDGCRQSFRDDTLRAIGDMRYCLDCYTNRTYQCRLCGDRQDIQGDELIIRLVGSSADRRVCPSCQEHELGQYTQCRRCEGYGRRTQMTVVDGPNEETTAYCSACLYEEELWHRVRYCRQHDRWHGQSYCCEYDNTPVVIRDLDDDVVVTVDVEDDYERQVW